MGAKIIPTPKQLREVLRYEQETGRLFWKARDDGMFDGKSYPASRLAKTWNSKYAERPAFTASKEGGYLVGRVNGRNYLAHRVIWAIYHGNWPEYGLDHINGKTADNRIENLRLATQCQNMANTKRRSDNTSEIKGVFWSKRSSKWCAQIAVSGVSKHLGYYEDIDSAAMAYRKAAEQEFGEFANFGLV